MDVDLDDAMQPTFMAPGGAKRPTTVPVDDMHPFELESYISNYTGRAVVDRLIHIIGICPPIASQAFHLAVQHIHQLRDPSLYGVALIVYESLPSYSAHALPAASEIASMDPKWLEEVTLKNQSERTKLEVELKTYSNNMIKESIRMAHRDLGDHFRVTGDAQTALKHYARSREFCASSQQVTEMCLSVLELMIEQRNYAHIPTYVYKADAAVDANSATSKEPSLLSIPSHKPRPEDRDKIQSKLELATALAHLGQGHYEKAAISFLKIGPVKKLGDWIGKLVSPGDIAIYGTLCALSSLSRNAIKSQILENSTFAAYIEHEPYIRELVEAYIASDFKKALDILSRYSTRHCIDVHLSPHVHDLTNLIRNCAVVLYFQPFSTIRLERMGQAFGWTVEEVEQQVVGLIQSGQINGRVDSQNKILKAKKTDYRADLFARAIKAGDDMRNVNRKVLFRMRLQQADLVIKAPKGSQVGMEDLLA